MAKISTRKIEDDTSDRTSEIWDLIEEVTEGAIGNGSNSLMSPGTSHDEAMEMLRAMFRTLTKTLQQAKHDMLDLIADNVSLQVTLTEAALQIDELMNVTYDDAMDHATADLMDAFTSSGAADVTDDGDLMFDARISFSKGDLKPILREAIIRWVEQKTK